MRQAVDLALHGEQGADALQGFCGDGGRGGDVNVMELAAHVRPTRHLAYRRQLSVLGLV